MPRSPKEISFIRNRTIERTAQKTMESWRTKANKRFKQFGPTLPTITEEPAATTKTSSAAAADEPSIEVPQEDLGEDLAELVDEIGDEDEDEQ